MTLSESVVSVSLRDGIKVKCGRWPREACCAGEVQAGACVKLCPLGTMRCRSATDLKQKNHDRNGRFYEKPAVSVSLRGRKAAVAILKPKAWHPRARYGSTKQKARSVGVKRKMHTVSLGFSKLRSGMPFRSVKDCRVGRKKLRPPRNDTKNGRFYEKTYHFLDRNILIRRGATPQRAPVGHGFTQAFACTSLAPASFTRGLSRTSLLFRRGATPTRRFLKAPFHAGASPHFTCEAYFTSPQKKFHCEAMASPHTSS